MSEVNYDIIFQGKVLSGHDVATVKQRFKQIFTADDARIEALFDGGGKRLKRGLDKAAAIKYKTALSKAGAVIKVVVSQPSVNEGEIPAEDKPSGPSRPQTLQERLAAQQNTPVEAKTSEREEGFIVAPLGADVLRESERQPQQTSDVDISSYSLRPAEGQLLDDEEREVSTAVVVDITGLDISAMEGDLLSEAEKSKPTLPDINVPEFGLAPPGADLEPLNDRREPVSPDVSGLSLEDR